MSSFSMFFNLFDCKCERSRLDLSQLGSRYDRQRTPLQDGDDSGNDPRLVLGFLRQCSGMFPKQFRWISVPVGSREIRPIWTEHPRCGTLSCWIPGTVFLWLCPQSFQKLELYTPQWFQEQTCFVTGCSQDTFVFRFTQLPTFAYLSMLPSLDKRFNSGEDWINCIFETILEYGKNVVSSFYEEIVSNYWQSIESNKFFWMQFVHCYTLKIILLVLPFPLFIPFPWRET